MNSAPVLVLLVFDAALLLASSVLSDREKSPGDSVLLNVLFFCSGMPALIYQVVWQRALFAIYGVNAQSVAVVVTAFMLGLGIGSLVGGRLSGRFPRSGILIFGLAELGVAAFGLASLRIFHWVATYTAGANLFSVILLSVVLLLIPTVLMGATLPLLVEHLVLRTNRVGFSVSTLYFVNTFGSGRLLSRGNISVARLWAVRRRDAGRLFERVGRRVRLRLWEAKRASVRSSQAEHEAAGHGLHGNVPGDGDGSRRVFGAHRFGV